jgi:hypothetical protein
MAVLDRSWLYHGDRRSDSGCGYAEQAARIADYQIVHTPESAIPFGHPWRDGCSYCGTSTWEARRLPDGRQQMRCTGCSDVITCDA